MLLGASLAMVVGGLLASLRDGVHHGYASRGAVIGGALLAGAVGVRVPQRLAMWVCVRAWQRLALRAKPPGVSRLLVNPEPADLPLYWLALSVIALVAGVAIATLPLGVHLADTFHDWTHARFVWSTAPHAIFHAALVFVTGLVPLAALGLAVSCAHHISCAHGVWEPKATGWLLIGGAGGALIWAWLIGAAGPCELVLAAAALPALMVSLVGVASGSPRFAPSEAVGEAEPEPLPIWSDRWPTLLRASIVAVGSCGACAAAIWHESLAPEVEAVDTLVPSLLAALGVGFLAGSRVKRSGFRSIGGFGVACASAGLMTSAGSAGLLGKPAMGTGPTLALALVGIAAAGLATAYGHQTLRSRVANRSVVGATVLARGLVGGAISVWIVAPLLSRYFGAAAALSILGLSLLALGGTLIIHEPSYSPQTRRVRLAAVFFSIAVITTFFLLSVR